MNPIDQANKQRDAKLRYRILQLLEATRQVPWTAAKQVRRAIDSAADTDRFEGSDHFVMLLQDLFDDGYIDVQDARTDRDQRFGEDYLNVRVKAKGVRFIAREEAPNAMIDDGRIVK